MPPAEPNINAAQDHRAIAELEAEIKQLERQQHIPGEFDILGGDAKWLATLKRRLRSVDPNNPWARNDWN